MLAAWLKGGGGGESKSSEKRKTTPSVSNKAVKKNKISRVGKQVEKKQDELTNWSIQEKSHANDDPEHDYTDDNAKSETQDGNTEGDISENMISTTTSPIITSSSTHGVFTKFQSEEKPKASVVSQFTINKSTHPEQEEQIPSRTTLVSAITPSSPRRSASPSCSASRTCLKASPPVVQCTSQTDSVHGYEQQRLKNIEENNKVLKELGLMANMKLPNERQKIQPKHNRKKVTAAVERNSQSLIPHEACRRSTRLRGASVYTGSGNEQDGQPNAVVSYTYEEPEELYEIGQLIECETGQMKSISNHPTRATDYKRLGGHNHMIYSMSCTKSNRFLAAGGGEGKVSFFSLERESVSIIEDDVEDAELCAGSAKLHTRWISRIDFIHTNEETDVLLSSADDGRLLLSGLHFDDVLSGGRPKCEPIARIGTELHRKGIFSFDYANGFIASASKDSTVGVSKLHSNRFDVVRVYDGLHQGVVKAVRWAPDTCVPSLFVSAGDDLHINVYDTRSSLLAASIEPHGKRINNITFCPSNANIFISGSSDKSIVGHDMRNLKIPLFSLVSHHHPSVKSSSLTSSIFYSKGQEILTIGDKTDSIYAYDLNKSTLERQMFVGFTPSCLHNYEGKVFAANGKTSLFALETV
eukprot:CFRG3338T1